MQRSALVARTVGVAVVLAALVKTGLSGLMLRVFALMNAFTIGRLVRLFEGLLSGAPRTPSTARDISAAWIQHILLGSGVLRPGVGPSVVSVRASEFESGEMGSTSRVYIKYDLAETNNSSSAVASDDGRGCPPTSVVVKLTGRTFDGWQTNLFGGLHREAWFYASTTCLNSLRQVARTPCCLHSHVSSFWTGYDATMVMEDISQASPLMDAKRLSAFFTTGAGSGAGGGGEEDKQWSMEVGEAEKALLMISRIHCRFLNSQSVLDDCAPTLDACVIGLMGGGMLRFSQGLPPPAEVRTASMASVPVMWSAARNAGFLGQYVGPAWKPGADWVKAVNDTVRHLDRMWFGPQEAACHWPWTLLHNDFHGSNCMKQASDGALVLLDFQLVCVGESQYDVGYFIMWSFSPEDRRKYEIPLLTSHHRRLVEAGLDERTYPLELYILRYKYLTPLSILKVFLAGQKIGVTGKDKYILPLLSSAMEAFIADHGWPRTNWERSVELRTRLLEKYASCKKDTRD